MPLEASSWILCRRLTRFPTATFRLRNEIERGSLTALREKLVERK